MAKVSTKRKSESAAASITEAQFMDAMQAYSVNDSKIMQLAGEMEEHINEIKDQYCDDIELLQKEQELKFAIIKGYCVANKSSLLPDERKSFENMYARIGFRTPTPSLKLLSKRTWDQVTEKLQDLLPDYVRTVPEPDKERLIADRDKEGVANLFPELGIKVSQEEKFFVELKKTIE